MTEPVRWWDYPETHVSFVGGPVDGLEAIITDAPPYQFVQPGGVLPDGWEDNHPRPNASGLAPVYELRAKPKGNGLYTKYYEYHLADDINTKRCMRHCRGFLRVHVKQFDLGRPLTDEEEEAIWPQDDFPQWPDEKEMT